MELFKAEFVNPFVSGALATLATVLCDAPERGQPILEPTGTTTNQINVVIGVTGEAEGHIILGMSLATADRIASFMIGERVMTFNAMGASAICELANLICGRALQDLSETGHQCELTPPTIIRGIKMRIACFTTPAILVPITLSLGDISLTASLRSRSTCRTAA